MTTKETKQTLVSKEKLLESAVHFGERKRFKNPKMKPFIAFDKDGTSIIDLTKTIASLEMAYNKVNKLAEKGGKFLFVGTNDKSSEAIKAAAERTNNFYIDFRWLGGLLTNQRTIQNSINKLRELERLEKAEFQGYTKKEAISMKRKLEKLTRALGGVKYMRRLPQAIIIASASNEKIAITEAKLLKIPTIGIVDTNVDPSIVNVPIFANDDSNKAVSLIMTLLGDAIATAQGQPALAAYKPEPVVEGIVERERKPRFTQHNKFSRHNQRQRDSQRTPERKVESKEDDIDISSLEGKSKEELKKLVEDGVIKPTQLPFIPEEEKENKKEVKEKKVASKKEEKITPVQPKLTEKESKEAEEVK